MSSKSGGATRLLKPYSEDSFRFSISEQVYQFLNILCDTSSKKSWSTEDAQAQLREFVEGNGVSRFRDVVRFPVETSRSWSFQKGYVPLFVYLSSESVVKKGLHADINKLYGVVHNDFKTICDTIKTHMPRLMEARSFKDGHKPLSGRVVFKAIFSVIYEYVNRFKSAASNPEVRQLVENLAGWFDVWAIGLSSNPPFDDECVRFEKYQKESIIENIDNDKERLLSLIMEPYARNTDQGAPLREISEGLIANLQRILDNEGPGNMRKAGPRHDNDHVKIQAIGVAPTPKELLYDEGAYLPGNFFEAPHHLEAGSVERLFDIQFRLLREEMIAPVQTAIQCIVSDLKKPSSIQTTLSKIIREGGGRYISPNDQDSVIFSVFTNITFQPLSLDNRGMSLGLEFNAPPGDAQSTTVETRVAYWEKAAKKRLTQGALIAVIWKDLTGRIDIYIGTVTSTPSELVDSTRRNSDRISIKVSFFDAAAELRILRILQSRRGTHGTLVLIEAPVFYEGVRPFLEALQRDPDDLPFLNYLRHQNKRDLQQVAIRPPSYSIIPGFSFNLGGDPYSINHAKTSLLRGSRLDPSQVDAVVSSLTRELSLIQGPPGTGKSYTGLELIRVLVKSRVSPILMIAFTNHALDHMLKGVLDNDITENIVRLGSRFAVDERLAQYSLEELEKGSDVPRGNTTGRINEAYKAMKEIQEEMDQLMKSATRGRVPADQMEKYLSSSQPRHYKELVQNTPAWIESLFSEVTEGRAGWNIAGRQLASKSKIDYWLDGRDIQFLQPPIGYEPNSFPPPIPTFNRFGAIQTDVDRDEEVQDPISKHREKVYQHVRRHGLVTIPPIPTTKRLPRELQSDSKVWNMSLCERKVLYDMWYMPATESIREKQLERFKALRRKHSLALYMFNEAKEEYKAKLLREAHIVGCTTTGAAKLISLLSEMKPKVLIVEEAGQVLESHILASLVGSVEHLIMIGDPLQLRPNINSWKLSSDNPVTGKIYKFNQSLMERLSRNGFPMAQLDVQRRMRPSISSLIKHTLYPNLQDNDRVLSYPDVRGMGKNVFFISHENLERGGGEDSVSKHNEFEVNLIYDLVAHLLRQGCYNDEGNIVVLAAYLGQVPKIQQKLQSLVTTVVDDRDADLLAEHGLEETELATTREMNISKRVLVRTLDNFQGEEGEVIILSLEDAFNRAQKNFPVAIYAHISFLLNPFHARFIQNTNAGGFLSADTHADQNAISIMSALVFVTSHVVRPASMDIVVSPAPPHALLALSHARGNAPITSAQVRAVCRVHDFLATCHVPKGSRVGTAAHPYAESHARTKFARFVPRIACCMSTNLTLGSMTITLPCRHIFTVSALDLAVGLADFYEEFEPGQWSKPIIPGGVRAPPTCPGCSGPIDSLRYGRALKNARSALLQHHMAAGLSLRLADTDTQLAVAREEVTEVISSNIRAPASSRPPRSDQAGRVLRNTSGKLNSVLAKEPDRPTAPELIENIDRFHGFSDKDAKIWKHAISGLIGPYRTARELTRIQDPATDFYQKTFAQLSRAEMGRLRESFSHNAPGEKSIEQYASHLARVLIGQFPPRATHRFNVEAFWVTGEIFIDSWERFAEFLHLRAIKDSEKACEIAIKAESWNKAIKCQVLALQARYELCLRKARAAVDQGLMSDSKTTKELEELCTQSINQIQEQRISVQQEYVQRWGLLQGSGRQEWVQETFVKPSNIMLKYWNILKRSVDSRVRCDIEIEQGELDILTSCLDETRRARTLSSEHFYQCTNGHPYVFAECKVIGGRKTCPECGTWVEDIVDQQRHGIVAHAAPVLA
ncbi:unnamed protein product [Rhizoctonia solani]|uniref:RZ-type domain-containing protein n=1 Tax=Rhizoctonia solani TaxID=456999 RepID=A0A8H3C5B6_9AGAM|nr:unnamed protein product [Rhizoctonia solani]